MDFDFSTDMDFSTEVAAGIAFLDEVRADDWRRSITSDPERLEMTSPTNCVLGIVVGDFWGACREYSGVSPESDTYFADMHTWAAARGFVVPDHVIPPDDNGEVWDELDFTWRAALGI